MIQRPLALSLLLLLTAGCESDRRPSASAAAPATSSAVSAPVTSGSALTGVLVLQFGPDLPPAPRARIEALLRGVSTRPVEVRSAQAPLGPLPAGSLVVALGETRTTRRLIPSADVVAQGSEGFVVRVEDQSGVVVAAADGNPPSPDPHHLGPERGLLYGAYALLEQLGFAFLHPLRPTRPPRLELRGPLPLTLRERPRWPRRGWHLHTMHPLELTDLCNGWGPGGPQDLTGWQAQLPEWDAFLEWLIANRQNEVEWVLLGATSWQAFADSPERQRRLKVLVDRAHAWGIAAGADAPLALQQQHAWRLLRHTGTLADEVAQIRQRADWVMGAGFDFLSTEMGFSEFTAPDDRRMVAWLDALTDHVATRWGKETFTKAHVSQGQTAPNFPDPTTGQPINFNFLSHYADPRLGVMPHTVQHYALDDPAPTYGATSFEFMRRFMQEQVGRRTVLWYPETAYWVSFDVDVPLFLPIYAERRLHDLRLIASDERAGRMGRGRHAGKRIDGQMVFSSGWEWGYWLNDVVAARAAWNPHEAITDPHDALRAVLQPLARALGPIGDQAVDLIVDVVRDQQALLIEGVVNGQRPNRIEQRNGQAYLQGHETWDEVMELAAMIPGLNPAMTQPTKLGLIRMRTPWLPNQPDYAREIEPLLAAMSRAFTRSADALAALTPRVPAEARDLFDDILDAARMTALRAKQVHGLYDYVHLRRDRARALPRLAAARSALDTAVQIVAAREPRYRVPADRIAAWRPNPTAYAFTYLWTVRSLHFWWRDEGKAVDAPWSPAYMNIIDPLDIAFGEGFWLPLTRLVRDFGSQLGAGPITDLLSVPATEPRYPPPGLRRRP